MKRIYLVLALIAFVLLSVEPVFAYFPLPPPPTIGYIVSVLILLTLIGFFILIVIVGFILSLIKKESKKAIGIFLASIILPGLLILLNILTLRTYRVLELPIYFSILASFVLSGIVFYRKWTRAFWILLSISMALGILSFIYFTITFNS